MSVIVKRLKSTSMEIYVKGAPEIMPDICDPASCKSPAVWFLSAHPSPERLRRYAVILHPKRIPSHCHRWQVDGRPDLAQGSTHETVSHHLSSWLKLTRSEVAESDLQFLGFIVFENKLKPGTAPNIHTLRAAHLACRMVTGDNVRTAISVARECGLVSHSASVYIPSFVHGTGIGQNAQLDWSSVDDERAKLDEYTLKPIVEHTDGMAFDAGEMEMNDYQLAVTGDVFKWMLDYAELETMERVSCCAQ